MVPWQTKRIRVKCDQPPEMLNFASFCHAFQGMHLLQNQSRYVLKTWKRGKTGQNDAAIGSQMVVKYGAFYYRAFCVVCRTLKRLLFELKSHARNE